MCNVTEEPCDQAKEDASSDTHEYLNEEETYLERLIGSDSLD